MSREIMQLLTQRARSISSMAKNGDSEGVKRSGHHRDKHVKSLLRNARATATREKTKETAEKVQVARVDRRKELANRKHDIREILKYNSKTKKVA